LVSASTRAPLRHRSRHWGLERRNLRICERLGAFIYAWQIDDPIFLCADATAAWQASWLDVFGVDWKRDDFSWLALAPPPRIYLGGITVSREAVARHVADAPGAVYDSWNALDLEPFGFRRSRVEIWYIRPVRPVPDAADPAELEIVRVDPTDLEEFEAVSVRGFGGEADRVPVGDIHPPNPDPRMTFWLGRVDGNGVCAAMSYQTDRAVGVFGVTTINPARGRGYATALMQRAVLADSLLPAVLNTDSEDAMRVYERLGFERVGQCPLWTPRPVGRTDPDRVRTWTPAGSDANCARGVCADARVTRFAAPPAASLG
jgi:GNAT superfamily N-acetyltransferase